MRDVLYDPLDDAIALDHVPSTYGWDGIAALRDAEALAGDELESVDLFALDIDEARELGVLLDLVVDEPLLG
jgi:hypothetical protein